MKNLPQGQIRKLILHFNIDKTIVMRDSQSYNNTDFLIRQILSELMWGKEDKSKTGEIIFKVEHKNLEFDRKNVEPEFISYKEWLDEKYHPLTQEEYDELENKEKSLDELNKERNSQKIKCLCDIVDQNNPGVKFKRNFEDMRKKLRIDEKIQSDIGTSLENKLEESQLYEKEKSIFNEEELDKKQAFQRIFKNSYHKIILSFFNLMINLKKNKQDYAIIFRFFGHDESDIEEFIYEFNSFCKGEHPRYCGDYGNKVKFDKEKEKKDFEINKKLFAAVSYRGDKIENEKFVFGTLVHPPYETINDQRENIEEFYTKENIDNLEVEKGYNEIFLTLMDKLVQNCTFVIVDDISYYNSHEQSHGKLMLVDPYDIDTLQIFFDTELLLHPEKIDVIDIITQERISTESCMNKYVVNVEPFKAITDVNYFSNKIEECIVNRKAEILRMQGKDESPNEPVDENRFDKEIKRIPSNIYLGMTIIPLLHNALTLCDRIRPEDPITFIANFLLTNKDTGKKIEEVMDEMPPEKREEFFNYNPEVEIVEEMEVDDGNINNENEQIINDIANEENKKEDEPKMDVPTPNKSKKSSRPGTKK